MKNILAITGLSLAFCSAGVTQADIFEWEFIDPGNPGLGKQESSILVPDGAGVDAVPNANLVGDDLTMAFLIGADLTDANFFQATLTNADFTGAKVRGAVLTSTTSRGYTASQLYSTASYQAHDLTGIGLLFNDLSGWDFAGQNLTNASFDGATLTVADLTGADLRGALRADLIGAVVTNLIRDDGSIAGLDLSSGQTLLVRDYDGNPDATPAPTGPIPILVEEHLVMDSSSVLAMRFEDDAWDSLISFESSIPVTLDGMLHLDFAEEVNLLNQLGRTLDLFDWTGVTPTGTFSVTSPYAWNLSQLYTTGEVTLVAVPEPSSITISLLVFVLFVNGSQTHLAHNTKQCNEVSDV